MRAKKPRLKDVDALFSKFIRARDGRCMAAGWRDLECSGALQAAHCIPRGYHGTRFDERNCHGLCQAHHMYETHHPLEGREWWKSFLGRELFDELRQKAMLYPYVDADMHITERIDLSAIAAELRAKLAHVDL